MASDCRRYFACFEEQLSQFPIIFYRYKNPIHIIIYQLLTSLFNLILRYLNESCHEEDDGFALSVVEDVMSSQVATVNSPVALDCLSNETGVLPEYVAWVTPIHEVRVSNLRENQAGSCEPRHQLFEDPCVPVDEQLILSRVVYFSGGHDHIRVEGNR